MQAEDIKLTLKQIVESKEVKDLSEQLFKRLDEAALTCVKGKSYGWN